MMGFATLALRLGAVYCFVMALPGVARVTMAPLMLLSLALGESGSIGELGWGVATVLVSIVDPVVFIVAGLLLLVFSQPWGRRLSAGLPDSSVSSASSADFAGIAFAAVGVLVFALAVPGVFNRVVYLISLSSMDATTIPGLAREMSQARTGLVGAVLQLILGAGLFFGARRLAAFWRFLRTAGTPRR